MLKFIKQNKAISIVIGLAVLLVIYLYGSPAPDTTTAHRTSTTTKSSAETASVSVEDEDVHFPRYVGTAHDPFIPGVSIDNPTAGGPGSLINGSKWVLTGINSINGVANALIENPAANQSEFLQVGDTWGKLRVVSISDDAVNFVNNLGQVSQMGFPVPVTPAGTNNSTIGSNAPGINQISPLPPLNPVATDGSTTGFRRFNRQPSN